MEKLTEIIPELNSEYTVIGLFDVPDDSMGTRFEVRDYSSDASSVTLYGHYSKYEKDEDIGFYHEELVYKMDITSPQHGVAVLYNCIAAFGKINEDWFESHGWTQEDAE